MGTKKKEALIKFNQKNIVEAASKLFETKGFEATTVDDIAKEADYSKSTVYVYFKSKDEILDTILLEHFILLREAFEDVVGDFKDCESCYLLLCEKLRVFQSQHPFYYGRLLKEIKICEQDIEAQTVRYEIYKVGEEINNLIEIPLRKGIESGFFREDIELIPTVFYLWSGISNIISFAQEKAFYLNMRLHMSKEEYMQYAFKLLLNSIKKQV